MFRVPPTYSGLKSVSIPPPSHSSPHCPVSRGGAENALHSPQSSWPPTHHGVHGPPLTREFMAPHSPWSSWRSDCAASGGLGHAGSSRRSLCGSGGITPCCGLSSQTSRGDKKVRSSQKGHGPNSAKLPELLEGKKSPPAGAQ